MEAGCSKVALELFLLSGTSEWPEQAVFKIGGIEAETQMFEQ